MLDSIVSAALFIKIFRKIDQYGLHINESRSVILAKNLILYINNF